MDRDRNEEEEHEERMRNMEQWVYNEICPNLAREKVAFLGEMEEVFEPIIKSGIQQNNFEWAHVKRFYNGHKNELTDLWALRIFCDFVLKLFIKFDCKDYQLIIKIIHMYHQVLDEYKTMGLCMNCIQLNYPKHYHYENLENATPILKKVNARIKYTYRFTNREFYSKLTSDALDEDDYVFLQFLMKYGLSYFPDDEIDQIRIELKRLYDKYYFVKHLGENDNKIQRNDFVSSMIKQWFANVENPNLRRSILILRAISICVSMHLGYKFYLDSIKCLNTYILTLPEAAISVKDVEDFLDLAFPDDSIFATEICSKFKELFPESPSLSSPRSLKYLCRCKLRDCSRRFPSFPAVLSDMQIPCGLKEYLLFLSD